MRKPYAMPAAMAMTRSHPVTLKLAMAFLFAGLTFVGANIYIPLAPVPITLQTLFVLLAGAAIGKGWGSVSQIIYVGAGALGLPIYATGAFGVGVIAGPTGGFLLSFLIAPFVVSWLLRDSHDFGRQVAAFTAGTLVIFIMGLLHLTVFYTHSVATSLQVGFFPFIPGAILKIAAAVSIHRSSSALYRHYRNREND